MDPWNIRILLVEDDPHDEYLLRRGIAASPGTKEIRLARNHAEFIAAIQRASFDCAVLDFHLPDCTAEELLPLLHKSDQRCPAIVVSGSPDQRIVIRSLRSGGIDFVPKGDLVNPGTLARRIEAALARRQKRAEMRGRIERRYRRLTALAEEDPLTGLANRRYVQRLLSGGDRRTFDRRGEVSAVMIDIDHFKRINDRCGHLAGDVVLRNVADVIRAHLAAHDAAARWGGEEFLVIKPHTGLAEAVSWAENLRHAIERLDTQICQFPALTVSAGVASSPSSALSPEMFGQADEALYLAKARGRNRVCTWLRVRLEHVLDRLPDGDGVQRRAALLQEAQSLLGREQWAALTKHSEQVGALAERMAARLRLTSEWTHRVYLAGLCHELGKAVLPERLLTKGPPLSAAERLLVAHHPVEGAELCARLVPEHGVAEIVRRQFQLDMDGTATLSTATPCIAVPGTMTSRAATPAHSQPAGTGETAHMAGSVLAVANAMVTMTTHRPYRVACAKSAAVQALRQSPGRYDRHALDAALAVMIS